MLASIQHSNYVAVIAPVYTMLSLQQSISHLCAQAHSRSVCPLALHTQQATACSLHATPRCHNRWRVSSSPPLASSLPTCCEATLLCQRSLYHKALEEQDLSPSAAVVFTAGEGLLGVHKYLYTAVLLPVHCCELDGLRVEPVTARVHIDDGGVAYLRNTVQFPGAGVAASADELVQKMPSFQRWERACSTWERLMLSSGCLSQEELFQHREYCRDMKYLSEQFMESSSSWLRFLELDQDLRMLQFERCLDWNKMNVGVPAVVLYQALFDVAELSHAGHTDTAAVSEQITPASVGSGRSIYALQLEMLPIKLRKVACLEFFKTGHCNRHRCAYAANGHKCHICGSEGHGTAQCRS